MHVHVDYGETPRRRAALALALDAAFSGLRGLGRWPSRAVAVESAIPRATGPIALAQAEHALSSTRTLAATAASRASG